MKNVVYVLSFILIGGFVVAQEKPVAAPPVKLSEVSQLKAENFRLRTSLTQCRVDLIDRESQLATKNLTSEQSVLEQQFRKELNCKETDKFNWSTLKCEAKDEVKKDSSKLDSPF